MASLTTATFIDWIDLAAISLFQRRRGPQTNQPYIELDWFQEWLKLRARIEAEALESSTGSRSDD